MEKSTTGYWARPRPPSAPDRFAPITLYARRLKSATVSISAFGIWRACPRASSPWWSAKCFSCCWPTRSARPPVLAPAPGDEPAHPPTPAAVAQPYLGSGGRLLSAAILFAVAGGVRHDLTGTGGGSPRQVAAQDETDPTRCLSSVAECPATVKGGSPTSR